MVMVVAVRIMRRDDALPVVEHAVDVEVINLLAGPAEVCSHRV